MSNEVLIELSNISAGYIFGQTVLQDIYMKVNKGEIVLLIGSNGSGKSTLLKAIFNMVKIIKGDIIYKHKIINRIKPEATTKLDIAFVMQGRRVFTKMTVLENLEMGCFRENKRCREKKYEEVFELFPFIHNRKYDLAGELSGGEQQMLAIARGIVSSPTLLLLDEPSLGLSPKALDEVFERIEKINQAGVSILMAEQNIKKSLSISHRAYILEIGKIVYHSNCDILLQNNDIMKKMYFGTRESINHE